MYSTTSHLILGFHGCDAAVARRIITENGHLLRPSQNDYDWLGNGVYFWENNPQRALEYAKFLKNNPKRGRAAVKEPGVIGAVIDLGFCLDLMESKSLGIVEQGYEILKDVHHRSDRPLPENLPGDGGKELLLRRLDCAVIETVHTFNAENSKRQYDSVRGVFVEGESLYPGAAFHARDHIQICIRNPNCIKGYFFARRYNNRYPIP